MLSPLGMAPGVLALGFQHSSCSSTVPEPARWKEKGKCKGQQKSSAKQLIHLQIDTWEWTVLCQLGTLVFLAKAPDSIDDS